MRTCPLGSMLWGRRSASSPSDAQLCTHGFDDSLSGCCEGGCLFAYYGFRGSGRGSIAPIRFVIGGACCSPFPPATSGWSAGFHVLPCHLELPAGFLALLLVFLAISGCQLVPWPPLLVFPAISGCLRVFLAPSLSFPATSWCTFFMGSPQACGTLPLPAAALVRP